MRSRISIDVDHDNQPVINIKYVASDDVRDTLVERFIKTFGGGQAWAEVNMLGAGPSEHQRHYIQECVIRPVCNYDLPRVVNTIAEFANLQKQAQEHLTSMFPEECRNNQNLTHLSSGLPNPEPSVASKAQ
jgi:hypothetical protein